uniref:Uncharacterized protein n=1 Tax=Trichogramma kaykai TaxID=54128 RepID=A0ABD2VUM6_9HYME
MLTKLFRAHTPEVVTYSSSSRACSANRNALVSWLIRGEAHEHSQQLSMKATSLFPARILETARRGRVHMHAQRTSSPALTSHQLTHHNTCIAMHARTDHNM